MEKFGIIAGNGILPVVLARVLKKGRRFVVAIAHEGETFRDIETHVDRCFWIRIGEFGKIIEILKREGIGRAFMIGGIDKKRMFMGARPDTRGLMLLKGLIKRGDDEILKVASAELEREGIVVEGPIEYLSSMIAKHGILTKRKPTEREMRDIELGFDVLKKVGMLDIGQSVVVKEGVIIAIEAIEGTDEAIRRGGKLGGPGCVVVKGSKPNQDIRFDFPVVGLETIKVMLEAGASVLAIEAEKTIMVDKEEMINLADREAMAILAI
jgi:DUF1009 family protein